MKTMSKSTRPTAPSPEGRSRVLVEQAGKRRITLTDYENGVTRLELALPPINKLILSGGGAKGVAYSGAVTALEQQGVLDGIQAVYGSSAGAIMAVLIASGMDARQFDKLTDDTDLLNLLDSSESSAEWFQQAFSGLGAITQKALPGAFGDFTRVLLSVLPRIQSRAQPLQALMRETARTAILGRIHDDHPVDVTDIRERLLAGGLVTFADLAVLNRHIPQIKNLNITGTAMLAGVPQLVVFSAALTPDLDIAMAAHVSASLPVVFRQPSGEGMVFQTMAELTFFQDGGVLLNTPVPQLIDPGLTTDLLSGSDMLILRFEEQEAAGNHGGFTQLLTDWLTGAPVSARHEFQNLSLKAFAEQTVVVPLLTEKGDFRGLLGGTLNFGMTAEIKDHLQERLQQAVNTHLERRAEKREHYVFESTNEALLNMDEEMLDSVLNKAPDGTVGGILAWLSGANASLATLETLVDTHEASSRLTLNDRLQAVIARLDDMVAEPAHLKWLALQLNRFDRKARVRLLNAVRNDAVASPVLAGALAEMREREIRVIASNIRKSVIFPSMHLFLQTSANINLLLSADRILLQATTASEVNRALDSIIADYTSRSALPGEWLQSGTVELARSWRVTTADAAA
ncbi:patatin-like phospholipase family protein [Pseudomonas syringae]|uniref:patatin-like phospholipase family protein n=1 Tax=Pseudomonas syringae TaxID=317 RepID=UPI00201BE69A|nr:patatin-like phospholipase family protein [Pseudomonas syringae]MCL6308077.1 patatin-like phospholipase family protein [Pseudomonas syringae]